MTPPHAVSSPGLVAGLALALFVGGGGGVGGDALWSGGAAGTEAAAGSVARDTIFPVARGTRLVLQNMEGEIHVETWAEPRVRIEPGRDEEVRFRIEGGERRVVRPLDAKDRNRRNDYRVTVPPWIALTLHGRSVDVEVEGVEGGVEVRTISGDVVIRGAAGRIQARSVEGELVVEDSRGEIRLHSLADDIRVARTTGSLQVETTDGDLHLLELDAAVLQGRTMDGDIEFSGRIREGGRYSLTTHDGDISVAVAGELGARVSVSTFDGSFESDFPVVTERYQGGRELRFTVGGGDAELVLRAFDGDIRLRRSR